MQKFVDNVLGSLTGDPNLATATRSSPSNSPIVDTIGARNDPVLSPALKVS
jgi:hypothetical protein